MNLSIRPFSVSSFRQIQFPLEQRKKDQLKLIEIGVNRIIMLNEFSMWENIEKQLEKELAYHYPQPNNRKIKF